MILLIVEKVKVAKAMAEAFGWSRTPGGFEGKFENKKIVCIPLRGHVVTYDEPKNVMPGISWESMDNLLPIPASVPKVRIPDEPNDPLPISVYYNSVERNIKNASEVILGTDCDAEGEYIGWEIIEHFGFKGRVRRAWLAGGLDVETMRHVMANLKEPHIHKGGAYAAEARSYSDYIYQILTRAYTYYARRGTYGKNLGSGGGKSSVMSVGRVQSAVVGMIVERERSILNFVPVNHFKITGDFTIPSEESVIINARYEPVFEKGASDRSVPGVAWNIDFNAEGDVIEKPMFTDMNIIKAFESRAKSAANQAVVVEYSETEEKKFPPKTFNTSEAMMAIAKVCKIPATLAQHIIEDLYEQGYISYPRTTKSELPVSIYETQRDGLFNAVINLREFSEQTKFVKDLHNGKDSTYKPFRPKVYVSEDMPHFGLVPTLLAVDDKSLSEIRPLKKDEHNKIPHTTELMISAYKTVIKQFIQAHYPPAIYAKQKIKIKVPVQDIFGNEEAFFIASGSRVKDPGWMAAFKDSDSKDTIMKALKKGQPATFAKLVLSESTTEPPKRYTQDDLPIHMEKINLQIKDPKWRKILKASEGIGTPATRKNIIKTILFREYVEVKGNSFYPTSKGFDFYDNVEQWMVRPEYTAMWEDQLRQMYTNTNEEENKATKKKFIEDNIAKIEKVIADLITKFGKQVEYSEDRRGGANVLTPKMIAAIKKICASRKEAVPKNLLKDPAAARQFLDAAIAEIKKKREEQGDGPSESQIELAKKLIERLGPDYPVPDDLLTNRVSCSKFIDQAIQETPPSEKQIALAQRIAAKLPDDQKPKDEVFKLAKKCSEFIDKHMSKASKTSTAKSGNASGSKSPQRAPQKKKTSK
ncbi:type IA DNA topoisomerase [Pseudomonas luteola]